MVHAWCIWYTVHARPCKARRGCAHDACEAVQRTAVECRGRGVDGWGAARAHLGHDGHRVARAAGVAAPVDLERHDAAVLGGDREADAREVGELVAAGARQRQAAREVGVGLDLGDRLGRDAPVRREQRELMDRHVLEHACAQSGTAVVTARRSGQWSAVNGQCQSRRLWLRAGRPRAGWWLGGQGRACGSAAHPRRCARSTRAAPPRCTRCCARRS